MSPRTHTALFYAAMFGALGAHLPFWPVWLEAWGLGPGEVGFYTAIGVAVRIVAGLAIPVVADRLDRRRVVMVAICLGTAAAVAVHPLIGTRGLLLLGTVAVGVGLAGLMPLGEALGAGAARTHGFTYAAARAAGSIAFLLANLGVGAGIARLGVEVIVAWTVACLLVCAALGRRHPGGGTLKDAPPPGWAQIGRMLRQPDFALFATAAGLILSSHAVFYAYGSVHWRAQGLTAGTIGMLWAFAVAVEIAVMLTLAPRAMPRLGAVGALALAGGAGIVRWGAMAADPPLAWLWVLQGTHALTFVAGHLGAIAFIQTAVPERYTGSAQGALLGLAGGVLTAAAMGLSAMVYPWAGGATYLLALAMSAAGLALVVVLGRRWGGGLLDPDAQAGAGSRLPPTCTSST